jgi:predicted Fe-S protein YdhL (DUF1289 family)
MHKLAGLAMVLLLTGSCAPKLDSPGLAKQRADLRQQTEKFADIPATDNGKGRAFQELADSWLAVQIGEWEEKSTLKKPCFAKATTEVPSEIRQLPKELIAAWQAYRCTVSPYQNFAAKPKGANTNDQLLPYQANQREYWQLVTDMISGKQSVQSAAVERYKWGGWCGTSSGSFYGPRSAAVFTALLAEKRHAEGVGAALMVADGKFGYKSKGRELRIKFLELCGVDWRQLCLGGLATVDAEKSNWSLAEGQRQSLLNLLLTRRGEREVRMVIAKARLAPEKAIPDYLYALASIVECQLPPLLAGERVIRRNGGVSILTPTGDNDYKYKSYGSMQIFRIGGSNEFAWKLSSEPASPAVQREIMDYFCSLAAEKMPVAVAEVLAQILKELRWQESKDALWVLLQHPSERTASQAKEALEAMGEKVVMPEKPRPLRYRLLVGGELYANKKIRWQLENVGIGMSPNTDANGEFAIPYEMVFAIEPDKLKVSAIAGGQQKPGDPVFGLFLPPPDFSGKPVTVDISAHQLDVELKLPRSLHDYGLRPDMKIEIYFHGQKGAEPQYSTSSYQALNLPLATRFRFSSLMAGKYTLKFYLPGTAVAEVETDLQKQSTLTVNLLPATDVTYSCKVPANWPKGVPVERIHGELYQNGKLMSDRNYDFQNHSFRHLSPGSYEFKIPSSAELKKQNSWSSLASEVSFKGINRKFEIPVGAPPLLNLGEFEIEMD